MECSIIFSYIRLTYETNFLINKYMKIYTNNYDL